MKFFILLFVSFVGFGASFAAGMHPSILSYILSESSDELSDGSSDDLEATAIIIEIHNEEHKRYKPTIIKSVDKIGKSSKSLKFNKKEKTIIFIPGFYDVDAETKDLMEAYFDRDEKTNFVSIKYKSNRDEWIKEGTYEYIEHVGGFVLDFIETMVKLKLMTVKDVELVGHCVGAHIAGWVAKKVPKASSLFGLDPLNPVFGGQNSHQLSKKDAEKVIIIHTNCEMLGKSTSICTSGIMEGRGHVDLYMENPWNQAGCVNLKDGGQCSHISALSNFAEIVRLKKCAAAIKCDKIEAGWKWPESDDDKKKVLRLSLESMTPEQYGKYYIRAYQMDGTDDVPKSPLHTSPFASIKKMFGKFDCEKDTFLEFYSYPYTNKPDKLVIADTKNLFSKESKNVFDETLPTVFLVHGYMTKMQMTKQFRKAYGRSSDKKRINLFALNWDKGAMDADYAKSATKFVPRVGKWLGKFIHGAIQHNKLHLDKIELIGHSLGAHISSYAAKEFTRLTKKTIPKITGLDPAGPIFGGVPDNKAISLIFDKLGIEISYDHEVEKLRKSDANHVIIFHSNANVNAFGIVDEDGHIDVFFNGGDMQPGHPKVPSHHLSNLDFLEVIYSHAFAHMFYCELIEYPHHQVFGYTITKKREFKRVQITTHLETQNITGRVNVNTEADENKEAAFYNRWGFNYWLGYRH